MRLAKIITATAVDGLRTRKPVGTPDERRFAVALALVVESDTWRREVVGGRCRAYLIPSRSRPDRWHRVERRGGRFTCTCEDYQFRGGVCAHSVAGAIYAETRQAEQSAVAREGAA